MNLPISITGTVEVEHSDGVNWHAIVPTAQKWPEGYELTLDMREYGAPDTAPATFVHESWKTRALAAEQEATTLREMLERIASGDGATP